MLFDVIDSFGPQSSFRVSFQKTDDNVFSVFADVFREFEFSFLDVSVQSGNVL